MYPLDFSSDWWFDICLAQSESWRDMLLELLVPKYWVFLVQRILEEWLTLSWRTSVVYLTGQMTENSQKTIAFAQIFRNGPYFSFFIANFEIFALILNKYYNFVLGLGIHTYLFSKLFPWSIETFAQALEPKVLGLFNQWNWSYRKNTTLMKFPLQVVLFLIRVFW